jgi:hypothetical protein
MRHVQVWHSRSGEVCWGMVRRCADWFVGAGASWFVVVCYGYVRQGSSRQVGLGADRCVLVGCGELRQARYVTAG